MSALRHKGCGGSVEFSGDKFYEYEQEDGTAYEIAAHFCTKCGKEIFGDSSVEFENPELNELYQ